MKVIGHGEEFDCECCVFAHMGILCGHALKVMDYVGDLRDHLVAALWARDKRQYGVVPGSSMGR